ncbi:MAG TPA: ABC transporter ATP-binding protein [Sandaracinaceae bacterium LLY-WYZ-13_1]|nr:ABC transporter ATP-binding protein [Sandaracinaceae bacterium LLY-WYZ-13_1]
MTDAALEATDLRRAYGDVEAVRGVSLRVEPGELYGLVGPDGAGKTTTIGCLAGLMHPTAGRVRVLGEDPMARGSSVRESLGLMPQEYSLYGDLTIAENLWFFGQLFGVGKRDFRARTERLLAITRLAPFVDRRADALSGGMYKKLALSCALLHEPRVLLLDEPTNGVDPVSRRELWELVYELVADGMAVLISTPYMDEAARCHRVGLMHHGAILAEGGPGELTDGLEHDVCEVLGGDREPLHAVLSERPEVVAASPAGERLRVVIRPGAREAVASAVAAHGAELRAVAPDFEDLFLARIAPPAEGSAAA